MRCRVLILGNRERARHGLRALLGTVSGVGDIHEASLGAESLKLVDEHEPDLLVIDGNLFDQGAVDLIRQVKNHLPHTKVILVAMYREWEGVARSAGADAFIDKCKAPGDLLQTISQLALVQENTAERPMV